MNIPFCLIFFRLHPTHPVVLFWATWFWMGEKRSLKGQLIAVFHYFGAKEELGPGFPGEYSEPKKDHSHKMQQEKIVLLRKKDIFHDESGEVLNKVTQKGTGISGFFEDTQNFTAQSYFEVWK